MRLVEIIARVFRESGDREMSKSELKVRVRDRARFSSAEWAEAFDDATARGIIKRLPVGATRYPVTMVRLTERGMSV